MPSPTEFLAQGHILAVEDDAVIFRPLNTVYALRLVCEPRCAVAVNQRVACFIHAHARKVYTVPSGGAFVTPISGPPRIIQGRIRHLDNTTMVLQAGVPILIDLPDSDWGYDLPEGALAPGRMVNAVVFPGTTIEKIVEPMAT